MANPRARFYDKFQREMEEYDQELGKKYDEDLNTTLILASIALTYKPSRACRMLPR
jgi:hypothetical protein